MDTILIAAVRDAAGNAENLDTLHEALRVTGTGMLGIFCVMALFAAMISLLTRLFPDGEGQS